MLVYQRVSNTHLLTFPTIYDIIGNNEEIHIQLIQLIHGIKLSGQLLLQRKAGSQLKSLLSQLLYV